MRIIAILAIMCLGVTSIQQQKLIETQRLVLKKQQEVINLADTKFNDLNVQAQRAVKLLDEATNFATYWQSNYFNCLTNKPKPIDRQYFDLDVQSNP